MHITELVPDTSALEKIFTGGRWLEGPCWIPETNRLRFSDVIGNQVWDFDPATGDSTVHLSAPDHVNGRTVDLDGSVIQCSHGGRRLERDRGRGGLRHRRSLA